ncbi:MAG: hypothetical protein CVV27_06110 [Candidatus Melainabacteria bacterium HGW-Melainabacteria-1]|nr:MAG: hypothetical protein CVV27_06110 [Candidatus Melainabacteria bacterium HGW-Melainabacteria-1]
MSLKHLSLTLLLGGAVFSPFWLAASAAPLNPPPKAVSLSHLAETEKLAYDLYVHLGQQWNHPVFLQIQTAERRHLQGLRSLLNQRQLFDPTQALANGQFSEKEIQTLYQKLKAKGELSLQKSLEVGLEIEELDILDLKQWQSQTQDPAEVQTAEHLIQASGRHLQAFYRALAASGGTYQPQYLSETEFQKFLSSAHSQHGRGHHF